ncbi:GT4 family glycosyltransferase PelF [Virgisporangium ochraceum]|uniref:Lipopolysaccharide glycosyltransferase, putative n=1 Tax=Virgisporangium ochraceum TaxID=65505 RepID=A0A8J4EEY0_9ACTN|nr:GT4 family glycosyltransferase PelF [Virgisporangium ochraceum]GIJ72103.1 lipopolysaccharide glycosyltransferase, putative [Virgisporangium ochraceum]
MKILLISEGTYPYATGGVSVWCDQLIRGMPECRWEVVALCVDGREREVWAPPGNLEWVNPLPLWGPQPHRSVQAPGAAFLSSYEAFLTALLQPQDPRSDEAAVNRSRFLLSLRGLYEYAASGGDLAGAVTANATLGLMMDAWHGIHGDGLTLADAVEAAWLLQHMLRPLAVRPVDADIVHSSMNGLSMLVAMATKWRYGVPVIMSEHGIYLRERYLSYLQTTVPHAVKVLVLSFFRALAGGGYLIADALAPHSAYNRRWQLQNGADPARMWTMYNGVSLDEFPVAESEPAEPTVVFMGRIDPLKDLHTLIRAFQVVRGKVPDARLRIYGGTPPGNESYEDSCRHLIDELGLTGAAVLEGRVDKPISAYHAGNVVALTSISEGFPYTVVEAMACGRAVVCTNVGGVAEAVGDAGLVVPPRDHVAVAEACVRILTEDATRRRMAATARERVTELFTLQNSLDAYRRVYRNVTAGLPASAPEQVTEVRPKVRGRATVNGRGHAAFTAIGRATVRVRGRAAVPALTLGETS